jgi:pimeloyl-ACP methyl ester carboxylesterase
MSIPTLDGIHGEFLASKRITSRVLFTRLTKGVPVMFLHGNWSCATWWEQSMLSLPNGFWGIAPDQRGFGESDRNQKVDATYGAKDWCEDVVALLDLLGIGKAHFAGCSLGGFILWQMIKDHPERILSITLINPGSPFGFGGTKDEIGTPCYPDFAGTGGGVSNMEVINRSVSKDRTLESPSSPRASIRSLFISPFVPPREEELLESVFNVHFGEMGIPGDFVPSQNWPFLAPGNWGPYNATSPKYVCEVEKIYNGQTTVPILWIRSSHDQVISDQSLSDIGYLGKLGAIPGWPGEDVYPPQPMICQTRYVLEKYRAAGGIYKETIIQDAAHIPFLEKPADFNAKFHSFLENLP